MPTPQPPYAATWTAGSGDWEDAANWLEDDPVTNQPEHYVPGSDNDVTIGDNGSPYTITYNSSDSIWSLNTGAQVTFDIQSGALAITYGGEIGDALMVDAGASLSIGAGYKLFVGSGSYTGALTGAGGIDFIAGPETIDTTSVTIGTLELGVDINGYGSTTTLDLNLTYRGNFLLDDVSGNNATLNLDDYTFTIANTATLDGTVTGSGTFELTGSATLDSSFQVSGGAKFIVASGATATEEGDVAVGNGGVSAGLLVVEKGGTYDIVGSGLFGDTAGANATITNLGAIDVSGDSTVTLNGNFNNAGSVTVETGSTLELSDGTHALDGTVTGGGTLELGFAAETFFDTTTLNVGTILVEGGNAGAFPTLKESLAYSGVFEFESQFGTLNLAGNTLTLSGASDILAGGEILSGVLDVTGTVTSLSGTLGQTKKTVVLKDNGVVDETGNVTLVGEIVVSAGNSYIFTDASNLNADGEAVINNGTLSAAAASGTSYLTAVFSNKGVLSAAAGNTLDLGGTDTLGGSLTGAGVIQFGFGAQVTVNTATLSVGEIFISGGNGGGTTTFNASATYSGVFDFSNQFGTLNIAAGKTLKLTGSNDTLDGGDIDGGGTIFVSGAAGIGGQVGAQKATAIVDEGAVTQTYSVTLNGSLTIDAGDSYTIADASNLEGGASVIANAGTLSVAANSGQSNLNGVFTNTGTLSVGAGATLNVTGTDTLHGTLSGAGELWFGFGASVAIDTGAISVGEIYISGGNGGGVTTFNVSDTYSGVFDFNNQFGTLDIASGKELALSGMSDSLYGGDIDGGGTIYVSGAAGLGANVGESAATDITDAGAITQTGGVSLNGTLTILGGKTYTIADSANLGGGSAVVVNSGSFIDNSGTGTSNVSGSFTNKGDIVAESGALVLNTAVLGAGTEQIDAAAYLQLNDASSTSQVLKFAGAGAELALDDAGAFQSDILGFGQAANEAIDLLGFDSNSTKSFETTANGLIVNIVDGSQSASLTFNGKYNQSSFQLTAGSNGELLTY